MPVDMGRPDQFSSSVNTSCITQVGFSLRYISDPFDSSATTPMSGRYCIRSKRRQGTGALIGDQGPSGAKNGQCVGGTYAMRPAMSGPTAQIPLTGVGP